MITANHANCKYIHKIWNHGKCTKNGSIFYNMYDPNDKVHDQWKTAVCDEWEGEENDRDIKRV